MNRLNNPLYTIYKSCPRCKGIMLLEYDEYDKIQKCQMCAHSWDLFGEPLEARVADEDTQKQVRRGWTSR